MFKKRIYLAIFLFLMCIVSAEDKEVIYSGTIYQESNTSINNQQFKFTIVGTDRLFVTVPSGSSIVINNGYCELIDKYDICVNSTAFWYHNPTFDQDFYQSDVKVYQFLAPRANIKLTRTVSNTYFFIGEEATFNMALKNTGKEQATSIFYKDTIPASFMIPRTNGCSVETATNGSYIVKWAGSMNINQEAGCSYTIRALSNIIFRSKASLRYNDGVGIKNIESDEIILNVPAYQLETEYKLSVNRTQINREFNLEIILKNVNNNTEIKVESFSLTLPPNLELIDHSKFDKENRVIRWSGTLEPGSLLEGNITLKADFVKNYTFKPVVSFYFETIEAVIEKEFNIEVYGDKLMMRTTLGKSVESLANSNITVEIINPSAGTMFKEISLEIASPMPGFNTIKREISELQKLKSIEISNISFVAPIVDSEKTYSVNVTINYLSDYGQGFTTSESYNVTVKKQNSSSNPIKVDADNTTKPNIEKNESTLSHFLNTIKEKDFKPKSNEIYFIFGTVGLIIILVIVFIIHKKSQH